MSRSPYQEAGHLLEEVIVNKRGLKNVAYSGKKMKCTKTAYAQACKTLQYKSIIDQILNLNDGRMYKSVKVSQCRSKGLLYVLLYELLFGINQKIRGGGMLKRNICKFESQLRDAKELVVGSSSQQGESKLDVPEFPRYIRVNTLKSSSKEVYSILQSTITEKELNSETTSTQIYKDVHVPNLLILSPENASKFEWYKHPLVVDGNIVLQDKSSCFSALALIHGSGKIIDERCDYIDACAAPGNKTTHLAALVALARESRKKKTKKMMQKEQIKSKVFALDKSPTRVKTLQQRISNFVPPSSPYVEVQAYHQDFLKIMPDSPEFKNVKAILLDPSCSGSGIINSIDRFYLDKSDDSKSTQEDSRVKKLAEFQKTALLHAMSFHNVERIVYSTCSIHDEENEIVVANALHNHNGNRSNSQKWKLVPPASLSGWSRRGHTNIEIGDGIPWTEEDATCCIRVDGHKGDQTNGFFVVCLERVCSKVESCENKSEDYGSDAIPFYNNEFQDERTMSAETKEKHNSPKKINVSDKSTGTKEHIGLKNKAKSSSLSEQKSAKKRAKKQAWKQKQKEQKLIRMKRREEKDTK